MGHPGHTRAKCEFIAEFGVVQIKEFKICGLSEFSRGQNERNPRPVARPLAAAAVRYGE